MATRENTSTKPKFSGDQCLHIHAQQRERIEQFRKAPLDDRNTRDVALGTWCGWPLLWAGSQHWPEHLRGTLGHEHQAAVDYLIRLAGAHGINGEALHHAGIVCRQLFAHQELWNLDAESKSCPSWPECLGQYRYSLPPGQQDAIEAGERVIQQLRLKTGRNDTPTLQVQQGANHSPATNEPLNEAFQAYWTTKVGLTQAEAATRLSKELARPVSQGQVSRWLKQVKAWKDAGNTIPQIYQLEPLTEKPIAMDPRMLDLGARKDGRADHQRPKRSEIENDGWNG